MPEFDPCVPAPALEWAARQAGSPITGARRLPGATTSVLHRLVTAAGPDLVLRRYAAGFLASEPSAPVRERDALCALDGVASIRTPHLIAADPDGAETGTPALLMSWIDGRPGPRGPHWAVAAAEALACLHTADPGGLAHRYRPYFEAGPPPSPPPWSRSPELWERAFREVKGGGTGSRLIHRDYHHGNLLWDGARTAVVDWTSACVGPPEADLAHFRINLHLAGCRELEDPFLEAYRDRTGGTGPDPFWDLIDAIDVLPWDEGREAIDSWAGLPGSAAPGARTAIERFIARALAELGV